MASMTALCPPNSAGSDEHLAARVRLASRRGTPPHVLHELASDPSVTVRAAVALNPAYAPNADLRLMADADVRIRELLAGKVARLLPGLSGEQHAAAQAHVHRTLHALADDAAERVRAAIASALLKMPEAPHALVRKLAQDPALSVSHHIIQFSPLLTDADLLELLATPSAPHTSQAVASRLGLSATVADHIAGHADQGAVCALLKNASANIREATLDALIGRAADHPEWHEPLVRRPFLPVRAVLALSRFVAGHLVDALAGRHDLPADLAASLRDRIGEALDPVPPRASEAEVLDSVRAAAMDGSLTEQKLLEAAEQGDNRLLAAVLAIASGVPLAALDRAVGLRSAKALVSLVWKAGFSMRAAVAVQCTLGQIALSAQLAPTPDGGFPLSPAEMEWQIELMGEPGR